MTLHAIQRAAQRFGLAITFDDLARIVADIQAGRALLARKADGDRLPLYALDLAGIPVRVAYDPSTARVVSIIPATAGQDHPRRIYHQQRGRVTDRRPEPRRQRHIDQEAE